MIAIVLLLIGAFAVTIYLSRMLVRRYGRTSFPYLLGFGILAVATGWVAAGGLHSAGIMPLGAATLFGMAMQWVLAFVWVRRACGSVFPEAAVPRPAQPTPTSAKKTERAPESKPEPKPDRQPAPARATAASSATGAIFLSYRRGITSDVTGRIYDRLVAHFGVATVFKDVDSIPLGVDFRKHLSDSIGQCRLVLAIVGTDWSRSREGESRLHDPRDFVRIELESAMQRRIPVVPVLVQGATPPGEGELPAELAPLAYHQAIAIRPDPDFHTDMVRLIKGIEQHLSR